MKYVSIVLRRAVLASLRNSPKTCGELRRSLKVTCTDLEMGLELQYLVIEKKVAVWGTPFSFWRAWPTYAIAGSQKPKGWKEATRTVSIRSYAQ